MLETMSMATMSSMDLLEPVGESRSGASLAPLQLDYASACKLLLPTSEAILLALVGCGGTGSWLAPSVARIGRLLRERFDKRVEIYFVDPDAVEEKNCYRQNFCLAEIGRNKAETLAYRYGLAWGVEITAWAAHFQKIDVRSNAGLRVLIGCVDGAEGRRALQNASEYSFHWWLDCGNHRSAGQVLLGGGGQRENDPFKLPGFCTWLPLPSEQAPDLLEAQLRADGVRPNEKLSCAEMALQDSQGLAINQRMAAEATDYLVRMLLTRDLTRMATYIDLASGASRSIYITPDSVKAVSEFKGGKHE